MELLEKWSVVDVREKIHSLEIWKRIMAERPDLFPTLLEQYACLGKEQQLHLQRSLIQPKKIELFKEFARLYDLDSSVALDLFCSENLSAQIFYLELKRVDERSCCYLAKGENLNLFSYLFSRYPYFEDIQKFMDETTINDICRRLHGRNSRSMERKLIDGKDADGKEIPEANERFELYVQHLGLSGTGEDYLIESKDLPKFKIFLKCCKYLKTNHAQEKLTKQGGELLEYYLSLNREDSLCPSARAFLKK